MPTTPAYKFTGKERDSETNLDYFGARYYGSSMGRFMSADLPFADWAFRNPQTLNLYTYGRNNPIRFFAHYRLGQIFENQGRKTEAKQSYEAALQLNPGLKEAAEALKRVS